MSFLLPEGKSWNVANWVSHGFFADAEPFLEGAPALAEDIKFCIETETDTIDLRTADQVVLSQLLALVHRVIAATVSAGANSFHNADGYPVYLEKIEQLHDIVAGLVGGST
jgi:hypothetical protein